MDKKENCPACGHSSFFRDSQKNILICKNCGLTVEGTDIDFDESQCLEPSRREGVNRTGPPEDSLRHDKGLPTKIDGKNRDARGKKLSPEQREWSYRLRKQHRRTKVPGSKEKGIVDGIKDIKRVSANLSLPQSVQEYAVGVFKKASLNNLLKGYSIECIASATVYIASRNLGYDRSLKEIKDKIGSGVEIDDIKKGYKHLAEELNIQLSPPSLEVFVSNLGGKLKISGEIRARAIKLVRKAKEENIVSGKKPGGIAGASIYFAALLEEGKWITQREIAEKSEVSENTVRKRCQEIRKKLNLI